MRCGRKPSNRPLSVGPLSVDGSGAAAGCVAGFVLPFFLRERVTAMMRFATGRNLLERITAAQNIPQLRWVDVAPRDDTGDVAFTGQSRQCHRQRSRAGGLGDHMMASR